MRREVPHSTDLIRSAGTMHVRKVGVPGARTIVMVPGFVISGDYFLPTVEHLRDDGAFLIPDLPGFGESDRPFWTLTIPQLAGVLIHWLDSRPEKQYTLVANSFGCQVAVDAAMRRSDLFDLLVLVSPAVEPGKRRVGRLLPALVSEMWTHSWSLRKLLLRSYLRSSPRRIAGTLRHALWDRMEEKLPHVQVPTTVIWGTADPLVSRRWAEEAANLLPSGTLRVVEGAPHAMNFDAPLALARALRQLLQPDGVRT